jgi:predicted DNA-binding transcriptional regulator AlpA
MSEPETRAIGTDLTMSDGELETLARHIAARITPDALLDAADVGAMLKCHPRSVTERYAKTPGFPPTIRLAGPTAGHRPRWQRRDIVAWIESQKERRPKKPGRPRKPIEW